MSVITISRGSYSYGKAIAEQVASRLGYDCIAREVLIEASKEFNIEEFRLIRALHDAPSILARFTRGRERYIAHIREALLRHLQQDNVVYHGLAGHFFVSSVPHVLKVRILADMDERIALEMKRSSVSRDEAARLLRDDDEERRKWSRHLHGIDTWDARLYDLVIHVRKIRIEDAVDIICNTVKLDHFQTTHESQRVMDDLALAAVVSSHLVDSYPNAVVTARQGVTTVQTPTSGIDEAEVIRKITELVEHIEGVTEVNVDTVPSTTYI
jgi:cytidylate kinase